MVQNIERLVILKFPGVAEPSAPNGRIHARSLKRLVHALAAIHLPNNLVKEILSQNRLIARHVTSQLVDLIRRKRSAITYPSQSHANTHRGGASTMLCTIVHKRIFALVHVRMPFRLLLKIACKHKASRRSYCQQWKHSRISIMPALPPERA